MAHACTDPVTHHSSHNGKTSADLHSTSDVEDLLHGRVTPRVSVSNASIVVDPASWLDRAVRSVRNYFGHLVDTRYAERHDLYTALFGVQFVALIIIIFGWSAFVNQRCVR